MTNNDLAITVVGISDKAQMTRALTTRKTEIDSAFDDVIFTEIQGALSQKDSKRARWAANALGYAGYITNDICRQAKALSQLAVVEIYENHIPSAIGALNRCVFITDASQDVGVLRIRADCLKSIGYLQAKSKETLSDGIDHLTQAVTIYSNLRLVLLADEIKIEIDRLRNGVETAQPTQTPADLLDAIKNGQSKVDALAAEIKKAEAELAKRRVDIDVYEATFNGLKQQIESLQPEQMRLQKGIEESLGHLKALQSQILRFTTAGRIPLWAAIIRDDITRGQLSELSLPLLERMRDISPEIAQPLLAEIRARNQLPPEQPFELSGLEGEQRLFAGIANSLLLKDTDLLGAAEILTESWEIYLQQIGQSGQ